VYGVLRRLGLNRLSYLNRITRQTIPYVREHPGDLVHLDIKTLGRIPPGGAKRLDPRWAEAKSGSQSPAGCGMGFEFVHVTVDDASCSAYVEVLPDERGHSAAGFLVRMLDSFAKQGISVKRVLTDNDSCYRSKAFRKTARAWNVKTKRTRPYRPQTNGKAEAFTRVLL
jgi:transposase InsO family protein